MRDGRQSLLDPDAVVFLTNALDGVRVNVHRRGGGNVRAENDVEPGQQVRRRQYGVRPIGDTLPLHNESV